MAETCSMEIDRTEFGGKISSFYLPNTQKLKNALNAEWTANVKSHQPLGFKKSMRPTLRTSRARFMLRCKGVQRQVLVVGKITIKNCNAVNAVRDVNFQQLLDPGENYLEFDVKLWQTHILEVPANMQIKGELSFRVSPDNFFFFKFVEGHMPNESDVKDCQLHIAKELGGDFKSLYEKQEFADVVIRCGTVDFSAHKAILSCRSPMFSRMLSTKMKEAEENLICIENMSPTVLKIMLRYIYCGVVPDLDDTTVGELLSAAEEYELNGLKKACLQFLQSNLTVNNALCTLAYADLFDSYLKKKTIEFICKEFDNLKTTEEWKKFHNERPALESEILLSIIEFAKLGSQCAVVFKPRPSVGLHLEYQNAGGVSAVCNDPIPEAFSECLEKEH